MRPLAPFLSIPILIWSCSLTSRDSLGIIYNALPGRKLQAEFQAWALGQYPDLWSQLEKTGRRGADGTGTSFKISRDIRA